MILTCIISICICMFLSSVKTKTVDGVIDKEDRLNSLIYLGIFGFSLIFDLIIYFIKIKLSIFVYMLLGCGIIIFTIIVNGVRESKIQQKRSQVKQVLQCMAPVSGITEITEEMISDPGFELEYDKNGNIEKIIVQLGENATKFTDDNTTRVIYNLNKFLPEKKWSPNVNFPDMIAEFIGGKTPPRMAKWVGDFLRPWNLAPIGVTGDEEVAWNMNEVDFKKAGQSMFYYEPEGEDNNGSKGKRAETSKTSSAPQAIIAGATGGGKAIYVNQKVTII